MNTNIPDVSFRIIRVKDISYDVHEKMFVPSTPAEQMKVNLVCVLSFNTDTNYVILEITASYYYEKESVSNPFASITVQNVFQVEKVIRFVEDEDLYLPHMLISTLVGLSLSHTRALFSKSIDGTAYNNIVLPIINPVEFSRKVFPHMFRMEKQIPEIKVEDATP